MNRKTTRLFSLLLAALFILPWSALASNLQNLLNVQASLLWKVNITHDLNGGKWPSGKSIAPRTISAIIGESMPHSALEEERRISPVRVGFHFQGWSVRFTSASDGKVIYDSKEQVWDLNKPFGYYKDDPNVMNCLMTANWKTAQSSPLSKVTLPDGRVLRNISAFPLVLDSDCPGVQSCA